MNTCTINKEITWTNFFGNCRTLKELDDQHLSNIMWFNEFFHAVNRYNSRTHFEMGLELARRGIERLPWKPLPIPREIETLKRMLAIHGSGDIYGNSNCGLFENKVIGSVSHIHNWENI